MINDNLHKWMTIATYVNILHSYFINVLFNFLKSFMPHLHCMVQVTQFRFVSSHVAQSCLTLHLSIIPFAIKLSVELKIIPVLKRLYDYLDVTVALKTFLYEFHVNKLNSMYSNWFVMSYAYAMFAFTKCSVKCTHRIRITFKRNVSTSSQNIRYSHIIGIGHQDL